METLLDTHALVWAIQNSPRLSPVARGIIEGGGVLLVSSVTAWEYVDLQQRGRLPLGASFAEVEAALDVNVLNLPGHLWTIAASLPDLHRDPVDRMLVAHAMIADLTLVTADAMIRRYAIRTLW